VVAKKRIEPAVVPSVSPVPEPQAYRVLDPEGVVVGHMPTIDPATLLSIYETMVLIRTLDERMVTLQRQGRIGFYGTCTGQEAPPIATAAALRSTDWLFPALREGAAMLYRGFDLETYVCQVYGNAGDVLKGRQMPSHYADRRVHSVSWSSCIANQLPQAMGAAWAAKLQKHDTIAVGFVGDGGTSEGDFHYALNFAAVYQAPVVLICQNNHWSISVPTSGQTRSRTIAEKAYAYGLPFARIDGNDALAVYASVKEAAERARSGGGPTFLEMLTYRIGAHSTSDDPRVYRQESEVEIWRARDPIDRLRRFLVGEGKWDLDREAALKGKTEARVLAAVKAAEARPLPARETLFDDVYATRPWNLEEQRAAFLETDPAPSHG